MKICEECKKQIKYGEGGFTMKSIEKEDFGRKFYVHKSCAKKAYGLTGQKVINS